ncbi:hypothetical protein N7452_005397 [Penicillium brevicompactum]|uniref:Uncharacterized protein n=1 Tax=Penicillium brevicompactum TaxID=5074 RepID=A0A9W9QL99_PENBR|nr:hypothetical protein N7452_005397 [Penicillium brevicompactum]
MSAPAPSPRSNVGLTLSTLMCVMPCPPGHNVENCYRLQAVAAMNSAAARSLFPAPSKGKTHRGSRGKGKGGMYLRWAIRPRNQMIYRWLISSQPSASILKARIQLACSPSRPPGGSRGEKASVPLNPPGTCLPSSDPGGSGPLAPGRHFRGPAGQ